MRSTRPVAAVRLFCGIIAVDAAAIADAEALLRRSFGEADIASEVFRFDFTDYYEEEMGQNLLRKFVSFSELIDPGRLADIKTETNRMEEQMSTVTDGASRRRANLDPGYVCASKVVLATTKDFSHRIYLKEGIYAEITMNFGRNGCRSHEWTYPDYKSGKYTPFFLELRRMYMTAV